MSSSRNSAKTYDHGSRYYYRTLGCRCEICLAWNAEQARKYRKKVQVTGEYSHGRASAYFLGCRCELCSAAGAAQKRSTAAKAMASNSLVHGTTTAYRYGCRCTKCKSAFVAADRESKKKHYKPPTHPKFKHGGTYGYCRGCRCTLCVEGAARTRKLYAEQPGVRGRMRAHWAKYNASKLSAITETTDLELIKLIYDECPTGYDVDHIIPLSVGGTHHQDNLQYLPKFWNSHKRNRLGTSAELYAVDWRLFVKPVTTIPSGSRAQESSKRVGSVGLRSVI